VGLGFRQALVPQGDRAPVSQTSRLQRCANWQKPQFLPPQRVRTQQVMCCIQAISCGLSQHRITTQPDTGGGPSSSFRSLASPVPQFWSVCDVVHSMC
jgi:hypothetical protein